MHRDQALDAAHPHDRPVSLFPTSKADHLEHTSCNRAVGDGTRTVGSRAPRNSRDW